LDSTNIDGITGKKKYYNTYKLGYRYYSEKVKK